MPNNWLFSYDAVLCFVYKVLQDRNCTLFAVTVIMTVYVVSI